MKRTQWLILGLGFVIVAILYFGFDIRPPEAEQKDRSRSLQAVQTSAVVLIREKLPELPDSLRRTVQSLQTDLQSVESSQDSVRLLKKLSGAWYRAGVPSVAGHYAESVAEQTNTAEAWSIAGTTFASGLKRQELSDKELSFMAEHARQAFENAISLEPQNVNHRVNLAVTYVQRPPEEQPMKGISILLELSEKYPESAAVAFQLGRFGMQTGQYEKAVQRLEKVVSLEPNRREAYCLLSEAYRKLGNIEQADEAEKKCKTFN